MNYAIYSIDAELKKIEFSRDTSSITPTRRGRE